MLKTGLFWFGAPLTPHRTSGMVGVSSRRGAPVFAMILTSLVLLVGGGVVAGLSLGLVREAEDTPTRAYGVFTLAVGVVIVAVGVALNTGAL